MPYPARSSFIGPAILTISVLILFDTFYQQASFKRFVTRKQRIELRAPTGAALATIFAGSPSYGLDQQTVKRLLAWRVPRSRNLSFAKSLCPALKGCLPVWRPLFGLGLQAGSSTTERCSQKT
jgi:hypothetical protein